MHHFLPVTRNIFILSLSAVKEQQSATVRQPQMDFTVMCALSLPRIAVVVVAFSSLWQKRACDHFDDRGETI